MMKLRIEPNLSNDSAGTVTRRGFEDKKSCVFVELIGMLTCDL